MKLTNPIKQQLALDIVGAAAKKHAKGLKDTAGKLHGLWREAYKAHFRSCMPYVPESEWVNLIQEGLLRSVSTNGQLSVRQYAPTEAAPWRTVVDDLEVLERYEVQPKGRLGDLVRNVKSAFSGIRMLNAQGYDRRIEVRVSPNSDCYDIPAAGCVDKLDMRFQCGTHSKDPNFAPSPFEKAWFIHASPLYEQTVELSLLYLKVFTEAEKHHGELTRALAAVSSAKQLIELFPEAEQFLPEPPPRQSKIVPANLFSNARKMLEEGIPT